MEERPQQRAPVRSDEVISFQRLQLCYQLLRAYRFMSTRNFGGRESLRISIIQAKDIVTGNNIAADIKDLFPVFHRYFTSFRVPPRTEIITGEKLKELFEGKDFEMFGPIMEEIETQEPRMRAYLLENLTEEPRSEKRVEENLNKSDVASVEQKQEREGAQAEQNFIWHLEAGNLPKVEEIKAEKSLKETQPSLEQRAEVLEGKIPEPVKNIPNQLIERIGLPIAKQIRRLPLTTLIPGALGFGFGLFKYGLGPGMVLGIASGLAAEWIKNQAQGQTTVSSPPRETPQAQQVFPKPGGGTNATIGNPDSSAEGGPLGGAPSEGQPISDYPTPSVPTQPNRPSSSGNPATPFIQSAGNLFRVVPKSGWLIFGIIFLSLIIFFIPSSSPTITSTSPSQSPIPITNASLQACTFTRDGITTNRIKSANLAGIFQEVANKSGIPAAVIASVAVHETQGFVTGADNNHDAFGQNGVPIIATDPNNPSKSACKSFATSSTGALGIMQVQTPPDNNFNINAVASASNFDATGVQKGLDLLGSGKKIQDLTLNDYCDIRTNVYMGAGVLLSKNGGLPPITDDSIKSAVCGYYGACQYGVYNYGEEVAKDKDNCQTGGPSLATSCPIPGGKITCASFGPKGTREDGQGICTADGNNNVGHCNLSYSSTNPSLCLDSDGTKVWNSHGIDVVGNKGNVQLPTLNGQPTEWHYIGVAKNVGVGWIRFFKSVPNNSSDPVYSLQFLHVDQNNPPLSSDPNATYDSGTYVANYASYSGNADHVHVDIGPNIGDTPDSPQRGSPNWKYPDAELGMCTSIPVIK